MVEPLKISNSELQTFKDCRRKWYLQYYRGYKTPEKVTGALALGTNVHASLATYYAPGGSKGLALGVLSSTYEEARATFAITDPTLEKEAKLARIMVDGYFDWIEETGIDASLEVIEAESEIEYLMEVSGRSILLVGKRDLIARRVQDGMLTLLDFKTCQSFSDSSIDLNEQARTYLLLQRLTGSTVVQYCLWRLLRKVQRTAKSIPPYYMEEDLYISEQELRFFFERICGEIRDIISVREALDRGESHRSICYPRPSRDCGWKCPYRIVCPMLDADPHVEEFLADQFTVGNPYDRYSEQKTSEV